MRINVFRALPEALKLAILVSDSLFSSSLPINVFLLNFLGFNHWINGATGEQQRSRIHGALPECLLHPLPVSLNSKLMRPLLAVLLTLLTLSMRELPMQGITRLIHAQRRVIASATISNIRKTVSIIAEGRQAMHALRNLVMTLLV
jgi:hypothetical protein